MAILSYPLQLNNQLTLAGIPSAVQEFKFHDARKWRFDLCWPDILIAVEVDGAVWSDGRHTRGSGFIKDMEKLNHAALLGFLVFRFTTEQVKLGQAKRFMLQVFQQFKIDRVNLQ